MLRYLLVILLAGCAANQIAHPLVPDYIQMSEEDRVRCASHGCAVYTKEELKAILKDTFEAGYYSGWKRASQENGHGI